MFNGSLQFFEKVLRGIAIAQQVHDYWVEREIRPIEVYDKTHSLDSTNSYFLEVA